VAAGTDRSRPNGRRDDDDGEYDGHGGLGTGAFLEAFQFAGFHVEITDDHLVIRSPQLH
jgi:hypothetical protein